MVKREQKRKVKRIVSAIVLACFGFAIFAVVIIVFRSVLPVITATNSYGKMIKPVGAQTTLQDLSQKLSDKNIIMEFLRPATESGVFIGVVRDGPTVYFSQNQDATWQVNSLYLIISRTTIDDKKPKVIDITSVRPIVKF